MKDNFSTASDQYAKYRPSYPAALYDYLRAIVPNCKTAWDCGTGNGQVAAELSKFIPEVYASDISAAQLEQAPELPNIHYSIQPAEKTNYPGHFFDLIMVAQAIHWFDFDAFYKEVHRVAKPGALLVVVGYCNLVIAPEPDEIIDEFYRNVVGPYWDKERRYLDEKYATIPFTGKELACPVFSNSYEWTFEHLMGYLATWSGVKHYIRATGSDPIPALAEKIKKVWGDSVHRTISFPLLLRVSKIS